MFFTEFILRIIYLDSWGHWLHLRHLNRWMNEVVAAEMGMIILRVILLSFLQNRLLFCLLLDFYLEFFITFKILCFVWDRDDFYRLFGLEMSFLVLPFPLGGFSITMSITYLNLLLGNDILDINMNLHSIRLLYGRLFVHFRLNKVFINLLSMLNILFIL